jgi:drug/metabolite transporter (DMT)-like permease
VLHHGGLSTDLKHSEIPSSVPRGPWRRPVETAGLTVAAMLAFAANSLLSRAALAGGYVDATDFTTIRLAGGTAVLSILFLVRRSPPPAARLMWGSAVALFAYAIGFSLAYVRVPTGVGALLLFAAVQLTMIAAGLRAGERPPPGEWAGLGVSIAGVVALTAPGLAQPDPIGALLMLGAGVAWGAYSLRGRRSGDALAANAAAFVASLPLALGATGVAVLLGFAHITRTGVLLALASGALASGLGYVAWYAALRELTATRAAVVQLSVPPLAATGGVLILAEHFSFRLLIASLLILSGIALATLSSQEVNIGRTGRR